jgi:hypothetical protein
LRPVLRSIETQIASGWSSIGKKHSTRDVPGDHRPFGESSDDASLLLI